MAAIGVDLGTSFCSVAVYQQGRVQIFRNDQGNVKTPTFVSFHEEEERLLGDPAKSQAAINPNNTIFDFKRLIGRRSTEFTPQEHWPFQVVEVGPRSLGIAVQFQGETRHFRPEELTAMILLKMKEIAEDSLGQEVKDIVVTVPSCFNDAQRQATIDAGNIAGLRVLRIMNDSAAAALAYAERKHAPPKEHNVVIFDFGGGTLDVSVICIEDGIIEVKAVSGDPELGGEDLDNAVFEHMRARFRRKYRTDLRSCHRARRRLLTACERAKRTLSSHAVAHIEIDSLHEGIDFNETITRARFEDLIHDKLERALNLVGQALRDARLTRDDIDQVLLVGGSSHVPKVQQSLAQYFGAHKLNKALDPDEAVVHGAAVLAALLTDRGGARELDQFVVVDVAAHSVAVERGTGLLRKNSTIPCKWDVVYTTHEDNQSEICFDIFEGELERVRGNRLLGSVSLRGIPPAPCGVPQINVTLDIDANGVVHVNAKDMGGRAGDLVHTVVVKDCMSVDEVEESVKSVQALEAACNAKQAQKEHMTKPAARYTTQE